MRAQDLHSAFPFYRLQTVC